MTDSPCVQLLSPGSAEQFEAARELLREYAGSLDLDLGFQRFDAELAELPGDYAAPGGLLLLAWCDGALAGCGALRPAPEIDEPNACEMRRLYVRRAFRGFGLGRLLAEALLDHGRAVGYSAVYLDTLDDMEAARELYATLGFEEVAPYYFNPIAGAHYLRVALDGGGPRY